uniref:FBA_2 domain-containing protein n=1 Tax=Caenorhabditis tropicalis TaxID=1561998 RepID=A0A1I7UQQ2_9PELO
MNHKMNALRLLVIECGNIDQDVLFDGLEEEMITVEGTMVYEKHHRSLGFPSGQKVLRRNDGMIAAAARHVIGLCIGIWTDIDSIRENEKGDYQMPPIMNPLDPFM